MEMEMLVLHLLVVAVVEQDSMILEEELVEMVDQE
jgi:hypothetical protein